MKKNVLGGQLLPCDPATGFTRDGFCRPDSRDPAEHLVCAETTSEFLTFTKARGNDLELTPGSKWCLCTGRWKEAFAEGVVAPVHLQATSEAALRSLRLEDLVAASNNPLYDVHTGRGKSPLAHRQVP